MSLLRLAYDIALRRTISQWRLEMVLFLGILLAVVLMSSSVVFSDLLAEAALRGALAEATAEEANFSVRTFGPLPDPSLVPRSASRYQAGLDFVDQRVGSAFGPYLQDRGLLFETTTFFFSGHPQLEVDRDVRPRGKFQYMAGLAPGTLGADSRIKVEGRWPYASGSAEAPEGAPIEVALDTLGAELLGLGVNDEMDVFPAAGVAEPTPTRVRIVGLFRRHDPTDEFWYEAEQAFSLREDHWSWVPLFTSDDAILGRLGTLYPGMHTNVTWTFYPDREKVRPEDVDSLLGTIRGVARDVPAGLENGSTAILLDNVLEEYREQLMLARVPLYLMVFLVTAVLVYYLALVTALVVRSRAAEIAVLNSRGATTLQLGLLALAEGLLLAAPAVALGPVLAVGVSRALGSVFFGVEGSGELALAPQGDAFLLGVGGAVLAVAVLTVSTAIAARQGIVAFRQAGARPPSAPIIHRYYLDILVLLLAGLVWWQIQSRGSFLVRPLGSGGLEIDYSLLLGPVLGLLALGLVVLRVFPWVVALLARGVEPVGTAWLMQGLRRISRDPIIPGTLVLLLMLATALGVVGSAFSSTLERSQRDRAMYTAGADLRIEHLGSRGPLLGLSDPLGDVDGVTKASEVNRTSGSLLTRGVSAARVSVLAVDTGSFADVAWYRPDFAGGRSLGDLTGAIAPSPTAGYPVTDGIVLASDTTALGVWTRAGRPLPGLALSARLVDARGYYLDVPLGELDTKGWRHLRTELPPPPPLEEARPPRARRVERSIPPSFTAPFTLLSIHVSSSRGFGEPGALFLDDLSADTPGGEVVIADFDTVGGWHVIEDYSGPGLYALEPSESVVRPGGGRSAAFSWVPGSTRGVRGIRAGGPVGPIPAIVSRSLLEIAEAELGDTLNIASASFTFPIKGVRVADYLPTLDPKELPFAVVDLRAFSHFSNLHGRTLAGESNELWVGLDGRDGAAGEVLPALNELGITPSKVHLASEMVSRRVEQPLVSDGWGGLLVLMFMALLLASASGVMLYSYVDTRERQTEFALLRTLGFSRGQLNGVVWFNLGVVVVCGVGLGTWAGYQMGVALLPVLEVGEGGARVTPPMVLETSWGVLLVAYLLLAGVVAATVAWLAWLTSRLEVQRVFRIGEG